MTRVLRTRQALRAVLDAADRPVGVVPTMGGLHAGHRSLMARARDENETTVVTIFVNPRQFDDAADFEHYPRDTDRDIEICEAEGIDLVWLPDLEAVYPAGFDTTVSVGALAHPLEGAARPGHFDGVATVVTILLSVVAADRAYFGQKDAQQLLVIKRMVTDLGLPGSIVGCPTVREPDGLAVSSRNVHLANAERQAAPILFRALSASADAWERGERSGDALRGVMSEVLAGEPLAQVDYVSCADAATLAELDRVDGPALLSLAVTFGATRLIDNVVIGDKDQ